jgi:ribose transport system substrate-binding protein
VLNDEVEGGRLAATRVATLLHGHGSVAILGINPDIEGIVTRSRSLEESLKTNYPDIQIVDKRMGSFNGPHEQQVAEDVLRTHPDLGVIVALMSTSATGAILAIRSDQARGGTKVIAFDEPVDFEIGSVDSEVLQNPQAMGQAAVDLIHSKLSA